MRRQDRAVASDGCGRSNDLLARGRRRLTRWHPRLGRAASGSFAAVLHVADAWLTVTADGEAIVVYADGQVTRHAAEGDEGSNGGEARPSPRPGSD